MHPSDADILLVHCRAIVSKPCAVLNNVTLVLSSQTEFDYVGYMYTMFNRWAQCSNREQHTPGTLAFAYLQAMFVVLCACIVCVH